MSYASKHTHTGTHILTHIDADVGKQARSLTHIRVYKRRHANKQAPTRTHTHTHRPRVREGSKRDDRHRPLWLELTAAKCQSLSSTSLSKVRLSFLLHSTATPPPLPAHSGRQLLCMYLCVCVCECTAHLCLFVNLKIAQTLLTTITNIVLRHI